VVAQWLVTSNYESMWVFSVDKTPSVVGETKLEQKSLGIGEVQADQVRKETALKLDPNSRELRCGEALGPSSVAITRGVEIFARAYYQGVHDGEHAWSYKVQFENKGENVVQMLTRHWIFVDAAGKVEEVKGPGARGHTPIMKPGDKWEYVSFSGVRDLRLRLGSEFDFSESLGRLGTSC